jgi:hypothetical protein
MHHALEFQLLSSLYLICFFWQIASRNINLYSTAPQRCWFVCIFACPLWASKQVRVMFMQKLLYAPCFGISIAKLAVFDLLLLADCEPQHKFI